MSEPTYFSYSVLRCFDEARDEALNVGVVALDATSRRTEVRVASDLGRVARTLPNVPMPQLKRSLASMPQYFSERRQELSVEFLDNLSREWGNGLRLSSVRVIEGEDLVAIADQLYKRYVAFMTPTEVAGTPRPAQTAATSRRIMRSVVSRLKKRGFEPDRDYEEDAQVVGRTRNNNEVPVWFPLLVSRQLLVDAMEVKGRDERSSIDAARLIATKSYEVLRSATSYDVNVVVGESENQRLNEVVGNVLVDEGRADGRGPGIHWKTELDRMVETFPPRQYSAF